MLVKLSLFVSFIAIGSIASADTCEVTTTLRDTAPFDPNADAVGPTEWYRNEQHTVWAIHGRGYRTGGNKTYWVRPKGTDLRVSGHSLGSENHQLQTTIPCCYPTVFQIVGMSFSEPGCWRITAEAGGEELEFVTEVLEHE